MKIRDVFIINPIKNNQHYEDYINYFDTSSVKNGKIIEVDYLESDYPSRAQRLIKYDDILYSSVRPNLRHFYHYRDNYQHAVASTGFFILRNKDNSQWSTNFCFYFLGTSSVVNYLHTIAELSQSTFPACSSKDIGKIDLPNFDYDKQIKIAKILNNYDQLIENNNKRIELLNDMAESIFNEWFIRFRYPGCKTNCKKDSELGKIPVEFDVLKINEIIDYYIGGGWGNDEYSEEYPVDAYVIRGTDFPFVEKSNISTCPYRYHKRSNYKSRKLKENDIILEISGGTEEQPVGRAILVTNGILKQLDNKVICASFCKLIRPKYDIIKPNYLFQWLKFLYNKRVVDRYQLKSTGIINFKFEYFIKKGSILVPPIELVEKYESIVSTFRNEIDILATKNKFLIKQRDSLLPRLMSGKLSVEGKEVI